MIWVDEIRARLRLERDGLLLEHPGGRIAGLQAREAFPWSGAGAHIVLMEKDEARAIIADPAKLDPASRAALEQAVRDHRLLPCLERIEALTFERSVYTWVVATDRGPRTFRTRHGWGEEPVLVTPDGQLLITATDGVRYRLPSPSRLTPRERSLLATLL